MQNAGGSSTGELDPLSTTDEAVELFNLDLPDSDLVNLLIKSLPEDVSFWQKKPWLLTQTDIENINYLLGDQIDEKMLLPHQTRYVDNRLFASVRAILAYVTGQQAKPEVLPSKSEDRYQRVADNMGLMLYQHAQDHEVNSMMRLALKNLISRKRGVIKLRYDENYGPFGDICTENIDPADIIIDRFAKYGEEPRKIYQRMRCTVEQLIEDYPDKEAQILARYSIIRQTHTQMTRMVTYYECWFSYIKDGEEAEGVAWFLPDSDFVLGKMENPNWIKKGSSKEEKIVNMTYQPIKPYIWLNYLPNNTGRSFIDETCLLDQAIPMQDILNKRGRQITENADYANPRILVDKAVMEQADADKMVNKNPKTVVMVDTSNSNRSVSDHVLTIPGTMLPSYVIQDKFDIRGEIDELMSTPTQFRGANAQGTKNPTLGQDLMVKNQAGNIQDDLVEVVNKAWRQYYTYLLQMMKVYLPDDYWVMTKGADGQYAMIVLNDENIDTNVRISIQTDSTLPLDKQSQRQVAIQLAQIPGRIDDLSLFQMLGLPDPEKLAERVQRFNLDRLTYMESLEQKMYDAEADTDISLVMMGKTPPDRDDYSEGYLNHWNLFIASNRFRNLSTAMQQKLVAYLHQVANKAATTMALQDSMLNPAGIIDRPPQPPVPQKTEQIRLTGNLDAQTSQQLAVPGQPSPPKVSGPTPGQV